MTLGTDAGEVLGSYNTFGFGFGFFGFGGIIWLRGWRWRLEMELFTRVTKTVVSLEIIFVFFLRRGKRGD